ncbi:MAG TPA: universal stress protein, partial [Bacteroidia bacterium]|nr:universal stress protein [Bacteroidia bacterium]
MKTILLATDYSKAAANALKYAIELAEFTKAKLVLFHAYDIPVPVAEVPVVIPVAMSELKEENEKAIKNLETKILKQTAGKIIVESFIGCGMPVNEILKALRKKKADVVIMGMKGAGKISERIIGSTATFLMKKTKVPVLVIPLKSKFSRAHKIVLAYDYQKTIGREVLKNIREFARLFKAEVEVLN